MDFALKHPKLYHVFFSGGAVSILVLMAFALEPERQAFFFVCFEKKVSILVLMDFALKPKHQVVL